MLLVPLSHAYGPTFGCRECKPLEEQFARHLICQLVSALEYLHFQKVCACHVCLDLLVTWPWVAAEGRKIPWSGLGFGWWFVCLGEEGG
jgi:hypothetical protein